MEAMKFGGKAIAIFGSMALVLFILSLYATALAAKAKWLRADCGMVRAMINKEKDLWIIDVRSESAFEAGHMEGAVNIPLSSLSFKKFRKESTIVTADDSPGQVKAVEVADMLVKNGNKRVYVLEGGIPAWRIAGYPYTSNEWPVQSVTPEELKRAVSNKAPMTVLDMRGVEERNKCKMPNAEPVSGKSMEERAQKLKELLRKKEVKGKQPKPVILVFSVSADPESVIRHTMMNTRKDIRYVAGGCEAISINMKRQTVVSGPCPDCPGKNKRGILR
jgi:rhodanese-related sulfurtransferase